MLDRTQLTQIFAHCHDVVLRTVGDTLLIYAEGMCDTQLMNRLLVPAFAEHGPSFFEQQSPSDILMTPFPDDAGEQDVVNAVFLGQLVLFNERTGTLFAADFSNLPQRSPEDSTTESSNLGPRDAFTESIVTNMALIRKRLRTASLHAEPYVLGRRTQTRVSLLFMSDIISSDILSGIRHRLRQIDIDALYSGEQLSALLSDETFTLVPRLGITSRPDMVLEALVAGRFALLIDGIPIALTGPVDISYLLYAAEDVHSPQRYVAFVSLVRVVSILITLFLPGFWIALTTFHQDQIPFPLLATITVSSDGTPFSEPVEMFIMLLMFQLFIEAGNRLPSSIGSMLSVVGGLIIGDAAIRSGLSSPATLLIAAVSSTSSFVLMPNALALGTILIRLFILLCSSFIGMFGFLVSVFAVLVYAASIRSYGVPFLVPISPVRFPDLFHFIFYMPWKKRKQRPKYLNVKDKGKQPEKGDS